MAANMDLASVVGVLKALDTSLQKSLKAVNVMNEEDAAVSISKDKHVQVLDNEDDFQEIREIYVRVVFIKLGEINTVAENFSADAFVQVRWREPKLDGKGKSDEKECPNWNDYWNPKIYVENCIGDPKESIWYLTSYDDTGHAYICQRRRIKGHFFERMELNSYPFDSQELTLTVTSHRGEDEIDLVADPSEISTINTQSFIDEQEWSLYKHITSNNKVTTNAYKSSKHKHPAVSISCKASRRFNFFIWNIILIMIFLGILLFTSFAVNVLLVQNRLQLSFIIILSNITFKFNISQSIPKVSYLTLLDKYVIIQMAMMCLVCLWHATVYLIYEMNEQDEALALRCDRIGFAVLLSIYVIFQLCFIFYATFIVRRKLRIFMKKEIQQKKMLSMMDIQMQKKWSKKHILPMNDEEENKMKGNSAEKAKDYAESSA